MTTIWSASVSQDVTPLWKWICTWKIPWEIYPGVCNLHWYPQMHWEMENVCAKKSCEPGMVTEPGAYQCSLMNANNTPNYNILGVLLNVCTLASLVMTIWLLKNCFLLINRISLPTPRGCLFYQDKNIIEQLLTSPIAEQWNCKENTMRARPKCRCSPYMPYKFTVQDTYWSYRNANYIENGCSCEMAHFTFGCTHCPASS